MKELSMHILDIVMNSVKAEASLIELKIVDSIKNNKLIISIKDDGRGMDEETLKQVINPFFTTRSTRKVGLGIPMLKEACERCNGQFNIYSEVGIGTTVESVFERNNIDRAPLGNMGDTIMTIINSLNDCELLYIHETDLDIFEFSTVKIKEILDGVSIKNSDVILWIKDFVNENTIKLYQN